MTKAPAASRTRTPAPVQRAAGPPTCRCVPRPYILATFRDQQLVAVERRHNRRWPDGTPQDCTWPAEQLDPVAWRKGKL